MELYSDIPRLYTAVAQWMACVVYISLFPKRWSIRITSVICIVALVLQAGLLVMTENVVIYLWVPVMLLAVSFMFGIIFLCMNGTVILAGYSCAKAFLAAEFAASLEWQIACFIYERIGEAPIALRVGLLFGIYGIVYIGLYRIEKKMQFYKYCQHLSFRDFISAGSISVFAFLFGNMSFVITNSPFSASALSDVSHIRTLGDFCGLVLLYAFQTKICEYIIEKELSAIQFMYKKQYDQYRYYQSSMEMIHIKYHDLKHQITGLRGEKDEAKREEWLDQLERELDENRLIDQTGNSVLDTMLGAKIFQARKNHIRITCVADGKLLNFMHVTDICTIFGNALDNAIESVITLEDQEKRMIHVTLSKQKNFILINIANYFTGKLKLEKGELPKTSKTNKENHGYGLKSIQKTVEKYGGSMSMQEKNNWFELRILIPDRNE